MDVLELLKYLLVFGLTAGICGTYLYLSWKMKYFERKNIPCVKSYPIVGSLGPVLLRRVAMTEQIGYVYEQLKGHRFGGMFQFMKPMLIVRDPELIRLMLVKDFDHFMDRSMSFEDESVALFAKSVSSLTGRRWRDMRAILSPAFTSSKIKNMFHLVSECGLQLGDHLEKKWQEHKEKTGAILPLEMKEMWTRYTTDVIASTAFGVQSDSLKQPENEFYKTGGLLTDFSGLTALIVFGYLLSPKLMKFLRIPLMKNNVEDFFRSLVHDTISTREKEGIVRPDMIHLLMQARKGELKGDATEEDKYFQKNSDSTPDLTDDDITAQAMIFFFAGFETTSTILSLSSYALAVHHGVQERLQQEIDATLDDNGQKLTYDSVQKMKYLDMFLSETMRMYPSVDAVDRKCVKRYVIPATETSPEATVEVGEGIGIPIRGLHMDPEYFPDPDKFIPERFSEENKHNIKPFTYLPFGVGPRNCIGMRFALMEVKMALAQLLSRFSLHVIAKTPIPLRLAKGSFNIKPEGGGFWVGVAPRSK